MDKNYYKILEIDQDASEEIIEKAYKTLVKKLQVFYYIVERKIM